MVPRSRSTTAAKPRKWSGSGSSTRGTGSVTGRQERADSPEEEVEEHQEPGRADDPGQPALAAEAATGEQGQRPEDQGDEAPGQRTGQVDAVVAGQLLALRRGVPAGRRRHGPPGVRGELGGGGLGLYDQPGRGAEARVAGGQRQP